MSAGRPPLGRGRRKGKVSPGEQVYSVVILDFDGVIIESNDAKTQAFEEIFSRFPDHREEMMRFHFENVSASRFVKFNRLREVLGRAEDDALLDELARDFSSSTRAQIAHVRFVPGAKEFLAEFSRRVPLYLASVTPQADLDEILESRQLTSFFRKAYGCPPWTKPAAIADSMLREHAGPASVVLIGDSPGDREAAHECGTDFIARDSGIPFNPPVDRSFPDLAVIADFLRPSIK